MSALVRIEQKISGIGFQPVMPETTGWKPIRPLNQTVIFRSILRRHPNAYWLHAWATALDLEIHIMVEDFGIARPATHS
jgi:hypothetical protein